jgi:hypothetical protein
MFRMMKRQGFARIYEIIKEYDPVLYQQLPSAESAVGPCSLCNKIFRDPEISSKVRKVFERFEQKRSRVP